MSSWVSDLSKVFRERGAESNEARPGFVAASDRKIDKHNKVRLKDWLERHRVTADLGPE